MTCGPEPTGARPSCLAVDTVVAFAPTIGLRTPLAAAITTVSIAERGMRQALTAIRDAELTESGRDGMSASITMLLSDGHRGVIGHRGDSRAYLIRRRRTRQLTIDQELTAEISGESDDPGVQAFALDLEPGDTLVLCTDGAEEVVEDPTIARAAGELSPRVLASRIVSAANRLSPALDATAVVVRVVQGGREPAWLELSGPPEETAFGHTLAPIERGADASRRKS